MSNHTRDLSWSPFTSARLKVRTLCADHQFGVLMAFASPTLAATFVHGAVEGVVTLVLTLLVLGF